MVSKYWIRRLGKGGRSQPSRLENVLPGMILEGDLQLGSYKIITNNLLIKEMDSLGIGIRNASDTAYKGLYIAYLYPSTAIEFYTGGGAIKTKNIATSYLTIQSFDGSVLVDNLKFIGGIVEIKGGKLVDDLDLNNFSFKNIETYEADYGGGFSTFTPPTLVPGKIFLARDTNATTPGWRLYAGFSDGWHYIDLT